METNLLLRYGQPAPPVPWVPLRAGPLRLFYDPAGGWVRRVRLGHREVLRGVCAAVRDRNWGTVPGVLTEGLRRVGQDRFQIAFDCVHRQETIHFAWHGLICGEADGTVVWQFDGQALTRFWRNRIGFCVLHPARECAGAPARQTRTDGTVATGRFPETIEPQIFGQASFRDLSALSHEVEPGLWAEVAFEGDVFEMEDQRNWTDASYKTYCTPLACPFPVEIPAGTRVRQRVTLRLLGQRAGIVSPPTPVEVVDATVLVTAPEAPTGGAPELGVGVASHRHPLASSEAAALRTLGLTHVRVDLQLGSPAWRTSLDRAAQDASQLGAGLEVALHLSPHQDQEWAGLAQALRGAGAPLVRVLVLRQGESATAPETLALARRHLDALGVPIGGGSDRNFCELNREQALGRFALAESEFLFWPITPQVHACDHASLMETLEAQAQTVASARVFGGDKPLVVSPVTLRPRFNAVATGPELPPAPGELPTAVDARQPSLFGAAWTLGSLAALAGAGVASITYYETTGWRGLMETTVGSLLPARFPSLPGQLFPLFYALGALSGFKAVARTPVSAPLVCAALTLFHESGRGRILAANLTDAPQRVRFASLAWPLVTVQCLDEAALTTAARDPGAFHQEPSRRRAPVGDVLELELGAYAMVSVEGAP